MAMVCPQCHKSFSPDSKVCPGCDVSLLVSGGGEDEVTRYQTGWHQGPWGRIVFGLILVQGLTFALQHLLNSFFASQADESPKVFWATEQGFLWLHVMSAVGLLIGGAVSGASQSRGGSHGALLGLLNGVIFVIVHKQAKDILPSWGVYSQPFVQMIFGMVGGLIGKWIWKPAPKVGMLEATNHSPRVRSRFSLMRGRTHFIRIILGAAFAGFGVISAKVILDQILRNGQGLLKVSSHEQSRIITMEIAGFCMLIGGVIAGSNAFNGFKQGLFAGFLTAAIYLSATWMDPKILLETRILMVFGIVVVGMLGGWFGSRMFPPLYTGPVRRRGKLD